MEYNVVINESTLKRTKIYYTMMSVIYISIFTRCENLLAKMHILEQD